MNNDVEVIQVVQTRLTKRGKGVEGDPVRRITQYWSMDGELLAEVDPVMSAEELRDFQMQTGRYAPEFKELSALARFRDDLAIVQFQIGTIDAALQAAESKRARERAELWRFTRAVLVANLLVGAVVLLVVVFT